MTGARMRRIGLAIAGALVVLLAVAAIVVTTPWFRERVRRIAVAQAGTALNGELTIGQLTGSLFSDVTLHDVAVTRQGQPVLSAAAITVRYEWLSLVRGNLSFAAIVIDRPSVSLVEGPDGWNVAALIPAPDPDAANRQPQPVAIDQLTIQGGSIAIEPLDATPRRFGDVAFEGGLVYDDPDLTLDIEALSARDVDGGLTIRRASARIVRTADAVAVDDLAVQTTDSAIRGRVAVSGLDTTRAADIRLEFDPLVTPELRGYFPASDSPRPDDLVVRGAIRGEGPLNALEAAWDLDLGAAGATAGRMRLDVAGSPLAATGRVEVRDVDLRALTGRADLVSRITGAADVDATLPPDDPQETAGTVSLRIGPSSLATYAFSSLAVDARLAGGRATFDGAAGGYGARITFDGTGAELFDGAPALAATGRIEDLNLDRLPASLGVPARDTDVTASYEGRYDGDRWSARLTFDESQVAGGTILFGTVVSAERRGPVVDVAVNGGVRNLPSDVVGRSDLPPGMVSADIEATASAPWTALGSEPDLAAFTGALTLTIHPSAVDEVAVDGGRFEGTLAGGVLEVSAFTLEALESRVNASGRLVVAGDEESDLTYAVALEDVAAWQFLAGETSLAGALFVDGRVQGTPARLRTTGSVSGQELAYGDTASALAFDGTFDAVVPDLDAAAVRADVTGEATFITIGDNAIDRARVAATYENSRVDATAAIDQAGRSLGLDGELVVHPEHQELHLRDLTLSGLGAPWRLATADGARVEYAADRIVIEGLALVRGAERIRVEGRVARVSGGEESDLNVQIDDLDVGDLSQLLTGSSRVTGVGSGRLRMTGTLGTPAVTGSIAVVDGHVEEVPFSAMTAEVALAAGTLTLDARIDEPSGNYLTAAGTVSVDPDGSIDLQVNSPGIDLALLQAFTTEVEDVGGRAVVDLHVGGTRAAPELVGRLDITDASALVVASGVAYHGLEAALRVENGALEVDRLTVLDDDDERLTVTGRTDLLANGQPRRFDLTLEGARFQVLDNDLGDVELTMQLRAEGDFDAPRMTGRIEVNRGALDVGELMATVGVDAPPPAGPVAPPAEPGLFERLVMEVDLAMPGLLLSGRDIRTATGSMGLGDLNMTIGGDLDLRKSAGGTLAVIGSLEAQRGFYEFQGRQFQVTPGSEVQFRGLWPVDPRLRVGADREISGVLAIVRIEGTLREPQLALSSRPPLSEGDVLSLIVFNQPINELGAGERQSLATRAGSLAAGAVAAPLAASIADALDLDLVDIEALGAGGESSVTIGQQVNERLFLGFEQAIGGGDASRLAIEYRLTDRLRLLTSVSRGESRTGEARNREAAGVDLIYVIRY